MSAIKRTLKDIQRGPKVYDTPDRAVCKRCHVVMRDLEPCSPKGEFYHPSGVDSKGRPYTCKNAGKTFTSGASEIVPYVRKAARRNIKRNSAYR
jgi:hypothetical protein